MLFEIQIHLFILIFLGVWSSKNAEYWGKQSIVVFRRLVFIIKSEFVVYIRSAPKVMTPILLLRPSMSEVYVGGTAVEGEPSHQYSITCCCCGGRDGCVACDGRGGAV